MQRRSLALAATAALVVTPAFGQATPNPPLPDLNAAAKAGTSAAALGSQGNPLSSDSVVQSSAVYRGSAIVVGGTSQQLMASNPARRGWNFQNQSTSLCYIKIGGVATMSNLSLRVAAGGFYETPTSHVSTGAINVTCALTGAAFYATEW